MPVPIQTEDLTTEMLAGLLRSDPAMIRLFLEFLFSDSKELIRWSQLALRVETQHMTANGKRDRLDLLLHTGSKAIIIECKTKETLI